jgi:hypothetical protein
MPATERPRLTAEVGASSEGSSGRDGAAPGIDESGRIASSRSEEIASAGHDQSPAIARPLFQTTRRSGRRVSAPYASNLDVDVAGRARGLHPPMTSRRKFSASCDFAGDR